MERRQLEYFLAVVEHGGFTAAATAMFVAQPSVSYAVRSLEKELGAPLLDRTPTGVRLTAAGAALMEPARQVLRALENARAHVDDVLGAIHGTLYLVCLPVVVLDPAGPALARFRRDNPFVRVRIAHAVDGPDAYPSLRSGSAELAIVDSDPGDDALLRAESLGHQDLLVALPPGTARPARPLTVEDLAAVPLAATHAGGVVMGRLGAAAAERGLRLTIAVEVENRETMLHLVVTGVAAAVLPAPLAATAAERGAVVVPLNPPASREIFLVSRRHATLSPVAQRFRHLLLADALNK